MVYIRGSFRNKDGYTILRLSNSKLTSLHRYIWQHNYGYIPKGCEIHHKDGNVDNNDRHNLVLCTIIKHQNKHKKINATTRLAIKTLKAIQIVAII